MDSELSLIEISGEEDSFLLQTIPIPGDAAALDQNYFPCSPLQSLDGSAPSVPSGSVDRQNIGGSKLEVPSLGVDSLQRKRKHKKCGYNLRKSLAWNRAFLTEEGVLDPIELSMISGNACDVLSDKLVVIHEDDRELSNENTVSHDKLFQKLPGIVENEGQSASRSLAKTRLPVAKPTRIPIPSAKRKVLAAQDDNSSRSKHSGGPSVTAPSSLKRAASSNSTNVACKELKKVSKVRGANPDLGVNSSATYPVPSCGYSKQPQHAKPDIPTVRNVRMKRSLSNAAGPQRNVTRRTPAGKPSTAKSTTRQASENMQQAKPQSRVDTMHVKNILKPPIKPSSRNEVGSARTGVSRVEKAEISEVKAVSLVEKAEIPEVKAVPLVEKAELSEVKIQQLQVRRAEPTGLRMPSPSFSFFAQPRASASPRPIINMQSFNALPPVSSNMKTPHRIGSGDTAMLAPVQKMTLTPYIMGESNAKWINSNVKASVGCNPILSRRDEDTDVACDNLKPFQQLDIEELSIHPRFLCFQKEGCENLREDITQSVCDVHLEDENANEGHSTGHIGTVTDTQAMEECIALSWKDRRASSQPNPEDYSSSSSHHPSPWLLGQSYCADDDREVHQSQNDSSLEDCNQTANENQCPERFDGNTIGSSGPFGRTDIVIPARWHECEDDDPDGLLKTGRRLYSEDNVNRDSSSALRVQIGMASLAGNHCLIIADEENEGSTQLRDSSSNSEQSFKFTSSSDDLLKGSTGEKVASDLAPASRDGDVTGGPNSFSVPSLITSDEPGSLDSPWLEEDERATSLSMASCEVAADGQSKDEIDLLKAGDFSVSITTTIHEEPIDNASDILHSGIPTIAFTGVRADHIGTPQSIPEPALSKEGAEDDHPTLMECCSIATPLQPIGGKIGSNRIAYLVQEDSSHDVGGPSNSHDIINANSNLESQSEQAFDELDISAPAESAHGNVAIAIDVFKETKSEVKIEMLDSAMTDDNISCEMNSLNTPKCVTFHKHALIAVEYEVCSHQLGNQQTSSPNGMLADKAANEESLVETEINGANNSSSLVSNIELNDRHILVALGIASIQEPEIGSASHGSANRIESPVAEDTHDDFAKCLSVDSPSQLLVGHISYNKSSSPVQEGSRCDVVANPSIGGDKIIIHSKLNGQTSASSHENVKADMSFDSNVQQETDSGTKMGEVNESTAPIDNLDRDQKQVHVVAKPSTDAIPYSDEWLAAIEAAGEDILKMKSGAVQNSPPERSEPEPSLWSPVRRKNNQAIGPFDCTKFVNGNGPPNSP